MNVPTSTDGLATSFRTGLGVVVRPDSYRLVGVAVVLLVLALLQFFLLFFGLFFGGFLSITIVGAVVGVPVLVVTLVLTTYLAALDARLLRAATGRGLRCPTFAVGEAGTVATLKRFATDTRAYALAGGLCLGSFAVSFVLFFEVALVLSGPILVGTLLLPVLPMDAVRIPVRDAEGTVTEHVVLDSPPELVGAAVLGVLVFVLGLWILRYTCEGLAGALVMLPGVEGGD